MEEGAVRRVALALIVLVSAVAYVELRCGPIDATVAALERQQWVMRDMYLDVKDLDRLRRRPDMQTDVASLLRIVARRACLRMVVLDTRNEERQCNDDQNIYDNLRANNERMLEECRRKNDAVCIERIFFQELADAIDPSTLH